jgi:hypothetical protein
MATIIFGPLVTGARGHVGGTTFSRGGPFAVCKRRAQPPRPRLTTQYDARVRQAQAMWLWNQFSLPLAAQWSAYGLTVVLVNSLGESYTLTGAQAWTRYCTWVHQCTGSVPATGAPTDVGLSSAGTAVLSYTAHNLRLDSMTPDLGATEKCMIQVFRPDMRRSFNRMPQMGLIKKTGPFGANYNLVSNIDSGWAVGSIVRVHVWWRFLDADLRLGTMQKQYLDFTVV